MKKLKISIVFSFFIFTGFVVNARQEFLISNYFRNDPTAQNILAGQHFSMKGAINEDGTISINSFAAKFINGLRQVGYTIWQPALVPITESPALTWLHKFQRVNKLPKNDFITKNELLILDRLVAAREKRDAKLVALLPFNYKTIVPGTSSEPSSEHAAALLVIAFKALPPHLVKWNEENIISFIKMQGSGGDAGGIRFINGHVCLLSYFPSLDEQCGSTNTTMYPGLLKDDLNFVYGVLHEYAHYLDASIYSSTNQNISMGIIDTRGFTEISFDTGIECNPGAPWRYFRLRNPSNMRREFVTNYAVGWTKTGEEDCRSSVEDFAESFAMYVMQGNVFRELSKTNPIIAKKYKWLKDNVFAGREYYTGNPRNVSRINKTFKSQLPSFMDYYGIDPNFVWNYKLITELESRIKFINDKTVK
jgi:hypothetical protein